jgi:predicted phosphodiesterase
MTKTDLARKYRDDHGMEMPTLKLARIMYKENNLLFRDVDAARSSLRQIEGKARRHGYKVTHPAPERPKNPYALPESDAEEFDPYFIKGFKRGLIINDIHLPYHDVEAISAVIKYAKKEKPDFCFVNGDLLDFHQLSYFERDPKKKSFATELSIFKQFFDILKKELKCKIYFKFGNHEERYQRFLWQKARELDGVEEFELGNIIKARAEGIEVIQNKRIVMISKLPFIHGHETGRGVFNPVNAARGLMLKAKHSAVKGDCHNTSEHTTKDILGKFMTTWSIGCLCGLTPQWLPINEWNHGFGIIDLDGESFHLRNYKVNKGEIY